MTGFINGWVPYWQHELALGTISSNKEIFNDILLFDWKCQADGKVRSDWYTPVPVERLKQIGLPYWVTFTSVFSSADAAVFFENPSRCQEMINNMISVAKQHGATGIDVDFESINFKRSSDSLARVRVGYPRFLAQLKKSAYPLKVSATIPARVSDTDPDWQTYDYQQISAVVDLVRVMAYDWHTKDGSSGPIAPIGWYGKVLLHSISNVPPSRLQMGIPAYGYLWSESGTSKTVFSKDADELAHQNGTAVRYDYIEKEGTFSYGNNVVWVATAKSMADRVELCKKAGISGVAIWSIGDESPSAWPAMKSRLLSPPQKISLANVQEAARRDTRLIVNRRTHPADVKVVQKALYKEKLLLYKFINGSYGKETKQAYAAWQRKLGYYGIDADGIPGRSSLKVLGDRNNFIAL